MHGFQNTVHYTTQGQCKSFFKAFYSFKFLFDFPLYCMDSQGGQLNFQF
jgi:hypothetical protein